jgi:sirohydrochlorin cobaltochelatase
MMENSARGVILVGHGGIPTDCPRDLVVQLKRLEAQRRESGRPPSDEERALDRKIRQWPRNSGTDPYQAGLETLGSALRPLLGQAILAVAYNEYCTPTLEEAVDAMVEQGVSDITVITTMFTPGGSHSEIEIPEILGHVCERHQGITLRYAWPFDLALVAGMLAKQVEQFSPS